MATSTAASIIRSLRLAGLASCITPVVLAAVVLLADGSGNGNGNRNIGNFNGNRNKTDHHGNAHVGDNAGNRDERH